MAHRVDIMSWPAGHTEEERRVELRRYSGTQSEYFLLIDAVFCPAEMDELMSVVTIAPCPRHQDISDISTSGDINNTIKTKKMIIKLTSLSLYIHNT